MHGTCLVQMSDDARVNRVSCAFPWTVVACCYAPECHPWFAARSVAPRPGASSGAGLVFGMTRLFLTFSFILFAAACGGSQSEPVPVEPPPTQAEPSPVPPTGCEPQGCSNTVCGEVGAGIISTCEWKAEYACYKTATCERQADGKCGWTQSAALTSCLASPPAGS